MIRKEVAIVSEKKRFSRPRDAYRPRGFFLYRGPSRNWRLHAHKRYRYSLRVALDTRDELTTLEDKTEFYYIEMIVRYLWAKDAKFSWYDYLRLVESTEKALESFPMDGRFYNIHGLLMDDLIEEVLRENSEEVSRKVQYNYDKVIKCFEDAYRKIDQCESDLQGVNLNNWAWFLYRRGKEVNNLDWESAAEKAVKKITECVTRTKDLKYAKDVLELYEDDLSEAKEFLEFS